MIVGYALIDVIFAVITVERLIIRQINHVLRIVPLCVICSVCPLMSRANNRNIVSIDVMQINDVVTNWRFVEVFVTWIFMRIRCVTELLCYDCAILVFTILTITFTFVDFVICINEALLWPYTTQISMQSSSSVVDIVYEIVSKISMKVRTKWSHLQLVLIQCSAVFKNSIRLEIVVFQGVLIFTLLTCLWLTVEFSNCLWSTSSTFRYS